MNSDTIDNLYASIGDAIKRLRKGVDKKQETLAGMIGMSRASLVNIEKGRHHVQIHVLYDIARALSCHPADLLPPLNSASAELPEKISRKLLPAERPGVTQGVAQVLPLRKKEVNSDKLTSQSKGHRITQK